MTKRNLTLGTASGRLGSVVYFRRRGQQIARVLVSAVNDPRTLAQCRQRSRFANYVTSWRLLRQYVEPSWRGVSRYGSKENAFYTHNRLLMPGISKEASRLGYALPPLGIITYGSLATTFTAYDGETTWLQDGYTRIAQYIPYYGGMDNPHWTADFVSTILAANIGVQRGDILHFLSFSFPFSQDPSNHVEIETAIPPRILHTALDTAGPPLPFAQVFPWWKLRISTDESGRRVLPLLLTSEYEPNDPPDGASVTSWAVWVERPSAPQYARYSRARLINDSEIQGYLRDLCGNTNLANTAALTYQNV